MEVEKTDSASNENKYRQVNFILIFILVALVIFLVLFIVITKTKTVVRKDISGNTFDVDILARIESVKHSRPVTAGKTQLNPE